MRVLVTAASRQGAAEDIGERIGEVLRGRGHTVDLRRPREVREIGRYDVVVLGSAVDAGHWQREARELVERAHDDLAARPVWLFSSGTTNGATHCEEDPEEAARLIAATHAYEHHVMGRDDCESWACAIADSISSG